ncbi:hypothetical protein AWU65_03845 [Paenibacillus glucanolyticus]|jgi:hypothetical protein|uniref:Uncharacterized protein n=1 Tax=Paenibacillus glucanolyticus TaxID=59843 RepID=A0A163GS91_9BACL|nr:hypothetical protein AWU65_03845 [Paenibacillus glucanolyticus]OMF65151.1 hypothetical protein BK142_31200 [Paenibacillus glucanolyticus]
MGPILKTIPDYAQLCFDFEYVVNSKPSEVNSDVEIAPLTPMDHIDSIYSIFLRENYEVRSIRINSPNKNNGETFEVLTDQGHFNISYRDGFYWYYTPIA